uniref:hypothetical protein n=1 Tax=Paenibacillus sp. FSL R7-0652 TaxID=2921687 RepID=UPI003159B861
MQIERIFDNNHYVTLEEIFLDLIDDKIDKLIRSHYDHNQVNTVTSHDERKNAA